MVWENTQQTGLPDKRLLVQQNILQMNRSLWNTVGRRLVETHAPELMTWLNEMLGFTPPPAKPILPKIQIVESPLVQIDPELTRMAYLLGRFSEYRAWALSSYGQGVIFVA